MAGVSARGRGADGDDPTPEEQLLAGMWEQALQWDVEPDMVYVLLDPGDADDAGEWAAYCYASWRASPPERYASFRVFMEAMYREFHRLQVDRWERAWAVFGNATTRALDRPVEAARLDVLGGRYERALVALTEAISYGRPRARGLRDQIRRLLGETYAVSFHELATDPRYVPEVLPVLAVGQARQRRDDGALTRRLGAPPKRCVRRRTRSRGRSGKARTTTPRTARSAAPWRRRGSRPAGATPTRPGARCTLRCPNGSRSARTTLPRSACAPTRSSVL
ncbi:hypothetical protein ACFV2X_06235 [Streptomyces sp. NPDC059679]|uniref:hypothetical protein n=1 Tax=Streptomyces sp. NPDC059679 TaxID=3346903 RepID=UPI0036C8792E